ncbi:MAG TPA: type II toxin-antitoxin system ParD family antitoxin [Acidobacteriaceae bacterium]|nr:type II toxin-antitoxin system ParD family antitoxin [Acidobacteriaceae bacterium]
MSQMNISITPKLAGYVRTQVKSGRYNNASEVVRDALRRMQEHDATSLRLSGPATEAMLADLTSMEIELIRRKALEGLADMDAGRYTVYEGRDGLKRLAEEVKARGRKRLREKAKE